MQVNLSCPKEHPRQLAPRRRRGEWNVESPRETTPGQVTRQGREIGRVTSTARASQRPALKGVDNCEGAAPPLRPTCAVPAACEDWHPTHRGRNRAPSREGSPRRASTLELPHARPSSWNTRHTYRPGTPGTSSRCRHDPSCGRSCRSRSASRELHRSSLRY